MNIFLIVYGVGALVSWVLMAGWSFAYWQGSSRLLQKTTIQKIWCLVFLYLLVLLSLGLLWNPSCILSRRKPSMVGGFDKRT